MIFGPFDVTAARKTGLMLSARGEQSYVHILRHAFPAPVRWYGPYDSFDPRFSWVLYAQNLEAEPLRVFLTFSSETLFVPTMLDECWVLSMHMGDGERTPMGELVFEAKTYENRPGDAVAANELSRHFSDRFAMHPGVRQADMIMGVPANPWKEPHNLPELLADDLSQRVGIPLRPELLVKKRSTEIKNLPNEAKLEALTGAYEVRGRVEGTVVVVDDLVQSGSTLGVIADLLRRNGASRIIGLSATKTVRGER